MVGLILPIVLSLSFLILPLPWWTALVVLTLQIALWPGRGLRAKLDHYLMLDGQFLAGRFLQISPGGRFWKTRKLTLVLIALIVMSSVYANQRFISPLDGLHGVKKPLSDEKLRQLEEEFALNEDDLNSMSQAKEAQQYEYVNLNKPPKKNNENAGQSSEQTQVWNRVRWTEDASGIIGID